MYVSELAVSSAVFLNWAMTLTCLYLWWQWVPGSLAGVIKTTPANHNCIGSR